MRSDAKVHPTDLKVVDMIVEDVESDLSRIQTQQEKFIKEIYDSVANVNTNSSNNTNNATSKIRRIAKSFDENEAKNDEDDFKFSHDLLNDDSNIANDLNAQFTKVTAQLNEYKSRYLEVNDKLKEVDSKLTQAETKLEESEDELLRLKEEMKTSTVGALGGVKPIRAGAAGSQLSQQEMEVNKRAEQIRKALLSEDDGDEVAVSMDELFKSRNILAILNGWLLLHMPFKNDIRQMQAKFGSSIASYFIFIRFMFLLMCGVAALMLLFNVLHLAEMPSRASYMYVYNAGGYIPQFMTYSSFTSQEALLYSTMIVLVLVYMVAMLCHKIVQEDRHLKHLASLESENAAPYSKEVLGAWDFSLRTQAEVDDLCGTLSNTYLQQIEATRSRGVKKTRSNYELVVLYTRRTLGFYMYMYVLFVSSSLIVLLTVNSKYISGQVSSSKTFRNFASLIAPFILSAINTVVPTLLQYITKMERWDSVQIELSTLLFREYVSNTLNSVILALSYLLLVDPFLMAERNNWRTGLQLEQTGGATACRFDQAAEGLFTLVVLTWVLQLISIVVTPIMYKFYAEKIQGVTWVREEFNVAENMVKHLNLMGLIFMSFPFAPLTLVFVPVFLFISFKWEKYTIKSYYAKPKRIGAGQKAGLFFTLFYLSTFILLGCSMAVYFLSSKTLPKDCDIQDKFVDLCSDDVVDGICTKDPSHMYYAAFKKVDYPLSVCGGACGPFVASSSNIAPFKHALFSVNILYVLWVVLLDYPYLPWLAVIVLSLVVAIKVNSMEVLRLSAFSKQKAMEVHIATIEAERKKQVRTIAKLKTIEQEAGGSGETAVDENNAVSDFSGGGEDAAQQYQPARL